ncbi:50S ribosomal protein L25/general stress protein Ctc [Chromatiales bacterium (ex Bugula neritina AB1)]|nr:50S ribosomal protein L25/general stress protein Ctc [Chromatiales bacterium (ex Bugula neritina AB1)]
MSLQFKLSAEVRSDYGKGASRRLRRAEKFPGIIYGGGVNPTPISLNHNEVINNLQHEAFFSHILTLNVSGTEEQAIIKDIQRHPFKQQILHIDFLRIVAGEAITVKVPLHYINEDTCVGVKVEGGSINRVETEISVSCMPKDLPEYIEVDLAELALGASLHLSDVKLPEGVTSTDLAYGDDDHDRAIVAVHATRASTESEDDGGDESAAGGEEGAEDS